MLLTYAFKTMQRLEGWVESYLTICFTTIQKLLLIGYKI